VLRRVVIRTIVGAVGPRRERISSYFLNTESFRRNPGGCTNAASVLENAHSAGQLGHFTLCHTANFTIVSACDGYQSRTANLLGVARVAAEAPATCHAPRDPGTMPRAAWQAVPVSLPDALILLKHPTARTPWVFRRSFALCAVAKSLDCRVVTAFAAIVCVRLRARSAHPVRFIHTEMIQPAAEPLRQWSPALCRASPAMQ
jgi:hypothetical protein